MSPERGDGKRLEKKFSKYRERKGGIRDNPNQKKGKGVVSHIGKRPPKGMQKRLFSRLRG